MIRLLNIHTLHLKEYHEDDAPAYAIASHRWRDDEATFKDVLKGRNQNSPGFTKIRGFCDFIKSWEYEAKVESINWLWIDTCCIDRKSSAELSEAINSMYEWYANAEICIAYLFDVQLDQETHKFESSDWFKRGWTLQELIAPSVVLFTDCDWNTIGHKSSDRYDVVGLSQHILGQQLNERLSKHTKISQKVLFDHTELYQVKYEVRLSWMKERDTTRVEDRAYCLLGIFDIYMPLIYGERQQAIQRLLNEILRRHSTMLQSLAKQTGTGRAAGSGPVGHTEFTRDALVRTMDNLQDRVVRLEVEQSNFRLEERKGRQKRLSWRSFDSLLKQFNELQQRTMSESLELQKLQAWNPFEDALAYNGHFASQPPLASIKRTKNILLYPNHESSVITTRGNEQDFEPDFG